MRRLSSMIAVLPPTGLKRPYYSAFSPIADTPLENKAPESPWRQHRLYQASYLLRDYGFNLDEMPLDEGKLPLHVDPKMAWAQHHLQHRPLELNRASREQLLRVPGIGLKSAEIILTARRRGKLTDLSHLRQLGVKTKNVAPFVLLDGKRPAHQLSLF